MTRPYRPSNGSEMDGFLEAFCFHCARDAAFRETNYEGDGELGCQILAAIYRGEDQTECIEDEQGSRCTAFTTDPTQPIRCDQTKDLFG